MKTILFLFLISVAGNVIDEVEDVSNRRHALLQKAHGRRIKEEDKTAADATRTTATTTTSTSTSTSKSTAFTSSSSSAAAGSGEEVDEAISIQLTRTPTKGTSTTKRTASKKPTSTAVNDTSKQQSVDATTATATATTPVESKREESKRESVNNTRASSNVDPSPTFMPSYVPTYMPTTEQSGKTRKVDLDYYDDDSIIISRTKSGKTDSGGGKAGKGSNPLSNVCQKRFDLAWEANVASGSKIAPTKEALQQLCAFDTTNTEDDEFFPNLSCPFIYTPDTGFLESETTLVQYFESLGISNAAAVANAFWLLQLYCECDLGITNECLSKAPNLNSPSPEGKTEYCIFAGIWNGDFALENYYELDKEVQNCGCYFVGVEQDAVDQCPGVDLGAFFKDPTARRRSLLQE